MFKSIAALALIATLFLIPATFAEDAGKQFEGVWDLEITQSTVGRLVEVSDPVAAIANITREGSRLVGHIYNADFALSIQIEFHTQTTGEVFLIDGADPTEEAADDEEAELEGGVSILKFDLQNRTHGGVSIAHNTFKSMNGPATYYQFIWTAPRHFVLNLYAKDGKSFSTFTGFRQLDTPEQSWFSKFGMPVMLVGSMLLSRWMRPSTPSPTAPLEAAAAGAGAESKKSK